MAGLRGAARLDGAFTATGLSAEGGDIESRMSDPVSANEVVIEQAKLKVVAVIRKPYLISSPTFIRNYHNLEDVSLAASVPVYNSEVEPNNDRCNQNEAVGCGCTPLVC